MTFAKQTTPFMSKVIHFDGQKQEDAILLDYQEDANFCVIALADGIARSVPVTEVHDPDVITAIRSAFKTIYVRQTLWERFCGLFKRKKVSDT